MFAEFFYETSENGPTRRLHFGLTSNGRADLYGASCSIRPDIIVVSIMSLPLRVSVGVHQITTEVFKVPADFETSG